MRSFTHSVRRTLRTTSTPDAAHLRPFSTTPSASFLLFNRPKAPSARKLVEEINLAIHVDRLDTVSKLYPKLIEAAQEAERPTDIPVDAEFMNRLLRYLSSTSRFDLLLRVFNDLPTFYVKPLHNHNRQLLAGMAKAGKWEQALAWLEKMESSLSLVPDAREWNIVLGEMARKEDIAVVQGALARMRAAGTPLNVRSYTALISAFFKAGDLEGVSEAQRTMAEEGIEADVYYETTLLTRFVDAGDLATARAVKIRLERLTYQLRDDGYGQSLDVYAVNALLKLEAVENGIPAAFVKARRYRKNGIRFDSWTLSTLATVGAKGLRDSDEAIEFLDELEGVIDQTVDPRTWTIALRGVLDGPGGIDEALKVYQEARDRSIPLEPAMVQPLLSALLLPSPTPESMSIARNLYDDLATSPKTHLGPDVSIYVTLLRACADPTHPDVEFSKSILADMRARGLRLPSASVSWNIVALMRASSSYAQAFSAYDSTRALDPGALDTVAYNNIIATFTSLRLARPTASSSAYSSRSELAPPAMFHEFLSDMRRSRNPPDSYTYSILLSYFSHFDVLDATWVAQIHSLIKLDLNIDPDIALFNSLMMAYSRVGAFTSAHGIWQTLRANRSGIQADAFSVSIIVDTCGHQGLKDGKPRGIKIWNELKQEGFPLNLKNWESMLECLCRWGDFDGAEKMAFEEMGLEMPVVAEVSTFETLLKFSRREPGRWESVRERIQKERPDVWDQVKEVAVRDKRSAAKETAEELVEEAVEEQSSQSVPR